MSVFVDTNVLVYAFDHSEELKRRTAQRILSESASDLVVSTQVLSEFYWVVTRRLDPPLDPLLAREASAHLATLPTVGFDNSLVLRGMDTSRLDQLAFWDALIVEAALAGGCDTILTEDLGDGRIIRGVEIVNPFTS